MFRDNLEVHKRDGRIFNVIAHPFTENTEDANVRFRPMIYEITGGIQRHEVTLMSTSTSEDAINAGTTYVKSL